MNTNNAPAVSATATAPAPAPKKNRAVSRMAQALAPVTESLKDANTLHVANKKVFALVNAMDVAVSRGKGSESLADKFLSLLGAVVTDKSGNALFRLPPELAEKARDGASAATAGNVPSREIRNAFVALSITLDTAYRAAHDVARISQNARLETARDVAAKKAEGKSPTKAELENENAMLTARLAELEAKAAAPAITAA